MALAEKNNRRRQGRGKAGSAVGHRRKANRLTTWFFVGGRDAFPEGRGSPRRAEARKALAGEMRTAESTETHREGANGQWIAEGRSFGDPERERRGCRRVGRRKK